MFPKRSRAQFIVILFFFFCQRYKKKKNQNLHSAWKVECLIAHNTKIHKKIQDWTTQKTCKQIENAQAVAADTVSGRRKSTTN